MAETDRNPALQSHLLLLRVWPEALGEGEFEWRGRIQSLHSGEVRHFRDGQTLYRALLRIIDDLELEDGLDDLVRKNDSSATTNEEHKENRE